MPRTRSIAWAQLKVGLVALVALVLTTALIVAVGAKGGFFWEQYPLTTRFDDVKGLKSGAVVRVAGKEVGQVTAVEFVNTDVEVQLSLHHSVRPLVTTDSRASLGSLSLLGEPILDITAARTGRPLADGEAIPSEASKGSFSDLATTASGGLRQVEQLLNDLRGGKGTAGKLVTDDALYANLRDASSAVAGVANAIARGQGTIGGLVRDPAVLNDLKAATARLNDVLGAMRSGTGPVARLLHDETLGSSLSTTLSSLEAVAARLNSSQGTMGLLVNDRELYDRLNQAGATLNMLADGVRQGRGTVGRLFEDPQLYENLNGAVKDLRALITAIEKDPKKYLTVRVSIF